MKRLRKKRPNNKKLVIVGLGNPGENYRGTRHNAGFAVIDYIVRKYNTVLHKSFMKPVLAGFFSINETNIYLYKPLTFMNRSGLVFDYILKKSDACVDDLILICDNMDLNPGVVRLKTKGSSAGHNGIKSVIEYIGHSDFKRLYIGVGRNTGDGDVIDHVLGKFSPEEQADFDEAVTKAAGALIALTERPITQVMNEINKRNK